MDRACKNCLPESLKTLQPVCVDLRGVGQSQQSLLCEGPIQPIERWLLFSDHVP